MDTIVTPVTVITLDSTRIVHSIKADLVARYFPPVVRLVQYDQSLPVIAVSLMQNGQAYTLPSGAAANIRVHKPDATYVYNPALGCDSTRKIVYFEVTQAMAAANGDGLAIVEIVVNGDIAGTSLITLHFEENPVPEDAIESSDEWETIYELGERIIASTVTPVSTAAGMTDHNVVYLYTGTESGWNQGHMYYYNGTTWVDAGIAVTDTTLSVAGLAADAKKTGDEIATVKDGLTAVEDDVADVKEDLYQSTGNKRIDFTKGGFINTRNSTVNISTVIASASWMYAVVSCVAGDKFTINGTGTSGERLYAFVSSAGTRLSGAAGALTAVNLELIAPTDSAYLVINSKDFTACSYYGFLLKNDIYRKISEHAFINDYPEEKDSKYWERYNYVTVGNNNVTTGEYEYIHTLKNDKAYHVTKNDTNIIDVRFYASGSVSATGVSAIRVKIYVDDPTTITGGYIEILGTSCTQSFTPQIPFKTGWNTVTVFTMYGTLTTWASITGIRVVISGTADRDVFISTIELLRRPKASIIFVDDSGFKTFYENGYGGLKSLSVPTTWALDPLMIGDTTRITQEQIELLAIDGMSEFSFHGYSGVPTSSMTADEILSDTVGAMRWLSKYGLLPEYFWRAAFVQNSATNYDGALKVCPVLATHTATSSPVTYPFPDATNIPRVALHSLSESTMDNIFGVMQKTHCVYVIYTHGIGTGTYDTSAENWAYFLSALSDAITAGYCEGTTYNRLVIAEKP